MGRLDYGDSPNRQFQLTFFLSKKIEKPNTCTYIIETGFREGMTQTLNNLENLLATISSLLEVLCDEPITRQVSVNQSIKV